MVFNLGSYEGKKVIVAVGTSTIIVALATQQKDMGTVQWNLYCHIKRAYDVNHLGTGVRIFS